MKTVLITGAARGIGAAAAESFAEAGYQVVINYLHSAEKAEALAARWPGRALAVQADVAAPAQVEALASLTPKVVFLDSSPFESRFDSVVLGYELGISLASLYNKLGG